MPSLYEITRRKRAPERELAAAKKHFLGREFVAFNVVRTYTHIWREHEIHFRHDPVGKLMGHNLALRWTNPYDMRCLIWNSHLQKGPGFHHSDWQFRLPMPPHEPLMECFLPDPAQWPETYPFGEAPIEEPCWTQTDRSKDHLEHLRQKHGARRFQRATKLAKVTSLSIQYWLEIASPEKFALGKPVIVRLSH